MRHVILSPVVFLTVLYFSTLPPKRQDYFIFKLLNIKYEYLLNVTHQLMHFVYNNILVKNVNLKHVRTLRHVSILIDHHQGVRRCLVKVTEFKKKNH